MARFGSRHGFGLLVAGVGSLWLFGAWMGCSGGEEANPSTDTTTHTTSAGGEGGTSAGGSGGNTTTTTSSSSTTSTTSNGGAGGQWPDCLEAPDGVDTYRIEDIWDADPSEETPVWVPGVIVTAVSYGACSDGHQCSIFVQQDASYATVAAATHQSIQLTASSAVAGHFSDVAVGDRVDIYAHAVRSTYGGANELILQVNQLYWGCALTVDSNVTVTPIDGVLVTDLSVQGYEQDYGPLFVRIQDVSGTPNDLGDSFRIGPTGETWVDPPVALHPYYLSGGQYPSASLTLSELNDFDYVQGVFAVFAPYTDPGPAPKYLQIHPRFDTEYPAL